jgi:hypothetical protein
MDIATCRGSLPSRAGDLRARLQAKPRPANPRRTVEYSKKAREEARRRDARHGAITGLAATGGVITSAGFSSSVSAAPAAAAHALCLFMSCSLYRRLG